MRCSVRLFYIPFILVLCAPLAACGLFGPSKPTLSTQPKSPVREFIISHTPGSANATGTVSDPEFGDNLRIVLEHEFLSASGETCRRASLFSQRGEAEVVVMCRDTKGEWAMAPRVWGQGLPPAAHKTDAAAPGKPQKHNNSTETPQSAIPEPGEARGITE